MSGMEAGIGMVISGLIGVGVGVLIMQKMTRDVVDATQEVVDATRELDLAFRSVVAEKDKEIHRLRSVIVTWPQNADVN